MLLWEVRDVGHILSDVGFTVPTWLLVLAEEVATTTSYFIMLIYYLTFFFHYKKERFHFGLSKVCSTNQSNILPFFLWMQIQAIYLYYGSVQTNFRPTLICLAQLANSKFIQISWWVRIS